jgi:hypothetical protein
MDLGHAALQFCRQIPPAQVDVQQCGLCAAVASKDGDLMDIPYPLRGLTRPGAE